MNKVYVLGGAQTDFERNWNKEGKGISAILKEIIKDGLDICGMSYSTVFHMNKENRIACFVGNFLAEHFVRQGHLGALLTEVHPSFYGVPSARYEAACASSSAALDAAITKIRVGDYDYAIVIGWELMKTVDSIVCGDYLGLAALYEKESKGIEYSFPKLFGKLADHLVAKYSLDEQRFFDNLAMISRKNYDNAKLNPLSQTRKWYMSYEHARDRGSASNPIVGGKLAVTDCSQITDGAVMVVLASERVLTYEEKRELPIVKGYGHRVAPMEFSRKMGEATGSPYILPWTRKAVEDAYNRANLQVDQIDVFETHDCFTSSEYAAISAFGITPPGQEYLAIENGSTEIGGKNPINPSGGLIGCGHPVGASGARMFLDLFKQITCKAGKYQVNGAKNGIMLNIGGSATTNYVFILGKDE